jgi:hypothetical protein
MSTRVKTWCQDDGLKGQLWQPYAAEDLGYWQRLERGTAIPLLMEAFGHERSNKPLRI